MKQNKKPTLLEWLKDKSETSLQALTGLTQVTGFWDDLENYGLLAFEKWLTADQQHYILSQYVTIYRD